MTWIESWIGVEVFLQGNAVSGHGVNRLISDAVATARVAGATDKLMVRADSG